MVRVPASLPVEWGLTKTYHYHGKIVSLSSGGCLLQTTAIQPLFDKPLFIRVPLPEQDWWEVQGKVLYSRSGSSLSGYLPQHLGRHAAAPDAAGGRCDVPLDFRGELLYSALGNREEL